MTDTPIPGDNIRKLAEHIVERIIIEARCPANCDSDIAIDIIAEEIAAMLRDNVPVVKAAD